MSYIKNHTISFDQEVLDMSKPGIMLHWTLAINYNISNTKYCITLTHTLKRILYQLLK